MILVATINMVVALLVLILERTQMIGILKALGANNWSIRKIFLYNASYLILRGLLWGNGIGIAILLLQKFGIIKLNPENYYVDQAPVYLNWGISHY
jgi:lipoprotein-releasing system permease protein